MRVSRHVIAATILVVAYSCVDQPVSPPARTVPQPTLSVSSGGVSRIVYYRQDEANGSGVYVINSDGTGNTRLTSTAQAGFDPRWSPDGTRIAFVSVRDGNAEIYVMNADGSNQTRITNDPGKDGTPSWSPDGSRIAFHSDRDGNVDIYVVNVDGTGLSRLTTDPEADVFPDWGPDGRILFASARRDDQQRWGIYVMNADGSNQTELTPTHVLAPPRWSRDERMIAFLDVSVLTNTDIYLMNADGSNVSQLTHSPLHEYGVAWSADGLRIAFDANDGVANYVYTMNRDGTAAARITTANGDEYRPDWEPGPSRSSLTGDIVFSTDRDDPTNTEIYSIRADGSGLTLVAARPGYRDAEPAWSPDGRKIAFTSNPLPTYPSDIYVMNADGSNQTRLTDAILSSPFGGRNFDPAWSPDGARIVFVGTGAIPGDPTRLEPDIFVMNADGSNQTRLTFSSALDNTDRHARFSPDGRKIAFASAPSGNAEIFVMNVDGSDPHAITNDHSDTSPSWSPNGQQIAFVRGLGEANAGVFVMNADGTGVRQLTSGGPKLDIMPTWSPDGRFIAYASSPLTTTGRDYDIYAIPADGSGPPLRITNLGSFTWMPDWHGSTTTPPENRAPTADAGADMTVYRSTPTLAHVSLDGSNSSDPDGDALAFTWLEGGTQIATGSNPAVDFALGTHNIELGVSDGRGGESHDFVVVDVVNRPPVVSTGGPYTGFEGSNVAFAATASDADHDDLSYGWSLGEGAAAAGPAFPTSHTYSDNGNYSASFSASDRFGGNDSKSTTVSIANVAPEARITGRSASPLSGSLFTLSGAFSDPGANDAPWNWRINWGDGTSATGVASSQADAITAQHRYVRADRYTVELAVTDKDGGVGTTNAIITVIAAEENVAPVVRRITLPASPIPVGAAASVRADFSDGNAGDAHTATIDWEGTTTAGVVTEAGGSGTVTGSNTYPAPGVYTVNVFVNDGDLSGTRSSAGDTPAYIVVYDPSAGFVTGGGWINSPAAACQLTSVCGGATGKATFGFVARYKKGATTPSGDTEFQFSAGGLRFVSSNYDWLTVAGSRAKYKGSGQINGAGNYGFLITAIDGDLNGGGPDQFRIKITDPATGTVVYDNKRGEPEDSDAATPIGGGSIVIHK